MNNTMKLVERLRRLALTHYAEPNDPSVCTLAADALEASTRRVKELEEALRLYVYETTHHSPMEDDGSHWCNISAECLSKARTTLANQGGEE